jgi:hypothetical protein
MSYRPIDALTMAEKNLKLFSYVEGMAVTILSFSQVKSDFAENRAPSIKLIALLKISLEGLLEENHIIENELPLSKVAQQALDALEYAFPSKVEKMKPSTRYNLFASRKDEDVTAIFEPKLIRIAS